MTCAQLPACATYGLCTLFEGRCVVGFDDCAAATVCRTHGLCASRYGRCVADVLPVYAGTKPRSQAMRNTGIAFVIAGSATVLLAMPLFVVAYESSSIDEAIGPLIAGLVLAPIGGTILMMGVPFWAIGAGEIPAASEPHNMSLAAGGVVLASLGSVGMVVSTNFLVFNGSAAAIPLVLSGLSTAGGTAMAAVGAACEPAGQYALLPQIDVGPGNFNLSWQF
jgi:hypothetical protein